MNFDILKSKLYSQIMTACANLFGLGDTATEAEVHNALEGVSPLAAQIQAARDEAVAGQSAQILAIQSQLETLAAEAESQRTELAALRTEMEAKDTRIAEMQTEAAAYSVQMEALKAQHKTEINTLAGQLSAMKAGQLSQQDDGGGQHFGAVREPGATGGAVVIKSDALSRMIANTNARNN